MKLNHWERMTLVAIADGDAGPHRVSILHSLRQKALITDDQRLTAAGQRMVAEEHARRRAAETQQMRESIARARDMRRRMGL